MTEFDSGSLQRGPTDTCTDLDHLDAKALTTPMSVLPDQPEVAGAEDMFLVQHTREHIVSKVAGSWTCDCKGFQYHERCYHVRRVQFALGERPIPAFLNTDAIDDQLGHHVSGGPRLVGAGDDE